MIHTGKLIKKYIKDKGYSFLKILNHFMINKSQISTIRWFDQTFLVQMVGDQQNG